MRGRTGLLLPEVVHGTEAAGRTNLVLKKWSRHSLFWVCFGFFFFGILSDGDILRHPKPPQD